MSASGAGFAEEEEDEPDPPAEVDGEAALGAAAVEDDELDAAGVPAFTMSAGAGSPGAGPGRSALLGFGAASARSVAGAKMSVTAVAQPFLILR